MRWQWSEEGRRFLVVVIPFHARGRRGRRGTGGVRLSRRILHGQRSSQRVAKRSSEAAQCAVRLCRPRRRRHGPPGQLVKASAADSRRDSSERSEPPFLQIPTKHLSEKKGEIARMERYEIEAAEEEMRDVRRESSSGVFVRSCATDGLPDI